MSARFIFSSVLTAAVLLGACSKSSPDDLRFKASDDAKKLPADIQAQLESSLTKTFGTPNKPMAPAEAGLDAGLLAKAPALFRYNCIHCHGVTGDGNGPTAPFLNPRPRDFRAGTFKFTSTAAGIKPTKDDLKHLIKTGVHYTAMPSFVLLPDDEVNALAEYVVLLSMRGQVEKRLVIDYKDDEENKPEAGVESATASVIGQWKDAAGKVVTPGDATPSTPESIARGKELFLKGDAQCASCHGQEGKGAAVAGQIDEWGFATQAADLTRGVYRGGGRPVDLYRRIHSGIKGSPMPQFGSKLSNEQIWDLVHFVQSLNKNRS